MGRYDDIIGLNRPEPVRERLSLDVRGAQFAPFAALNGHEEALMETTRQTLSFRKPGEYDLKEMSETLSLLMMQNKLAEVEIKYFVNDMIKDGGEYRTVTGVIRRIDEYEREILLTDSSRIPLDSILSLKILESDN